MSDDENLWPVEPSQIAADALADPRLPVDLFARIVALAQDPWLPGSHPAEQGEPWRTVPIPDGGGIVEYVINQSTKCSSLGSSPSDKVFLPPMRVSIHGWV